MVIGIILLGLTALVSIAGLWSDYFTADSSEALNETKNKKKRRLNFFITTLILICLVGSCIQFVNDKIDSISQLEQQLRSYKQIDTIRQVGIEASNRLDTIKIKSESIIATLDLFDTSFQTLLSNQDIANGFQIRADRVAYPLFPLVVEIYARINLSQLTNEQQKLHQDILNCFNENLGIYNEGSIFKMANLPGTRSYYIYNPHNIDSFKNPGTSRLRQLIYQLVTKTNFSFVFGFYKNRPDIATSDSKGTTMFAKSYANKVDILNSYIFFDLSKRSLLFYMECDVNESQVFQRNLYGVIDTRDKFLRIKSYFNDNREIVPFTEQLTFRCGKEKKTILDFQFKKSELIPGCLPNAGNIFTYQSTVHKIKDSDFKFGY